MCFFQQLHFSDEGYVVRCESCKRYQIGFGSTMLTLHERDLRILNRLVKQRLDEPDVILNEEIKSVFLPTPHEGMAMLLNYRELKSFANILDLADNEEKALSLLQLFDQ